MTAPSNELQAAIYGVLVNDPVVSAIVGDRVIDGAANQDYAEAYITFGDFDELPIYAVCKSIDETRFQLDLWSGYQGGYQEVKELAFAVVSALDVDLSLPVHSAMRPRVVRKNYGRDPDNKNSRCILQFETMVEAHG